MLRFFRWIKEKLRVHTLFVKISSSIAFFPSLIAILIFILGLVTMYLDTQDLSYDLTKHIPYLVTRNPETARSLLSSLTGGMFSLMVFSFSMVMVVLTVASSNYTPRVLPGLISTKRHQIVLGLYLGTIAFLLIVHINTGGQDFDFEVPVLSIFLAVMLVICCFAAFVWFIHGISQNIQIGNILANLYKETRQIITEKQRHDSVEELPSTDRWATVSSSRTGYFQSINTDVLVEIARQQQAQLLVLHPFGQFLLEGMPLVISSKPLPEVDALRIQGQSDFYHQERISINYSFGFKHITEVATKALSPGINDPGTAITALDYLTQLYKDLLQVGKYRVIKDQEGVIRVFFKESGFKEVFDKNISSIRTYGAGDPGVVRQLQQMLSVLEGDAESEKYKALFLQERIALVQQASNPSKLEEELKRKKEGK